MFKNLFFLLIFMCLFSCNYPGKGSLGGWSYFTFPIQKNKFKLAVDSFRKAHPENVIPEKWQYDSDYWQKGTGALEGDVLYLNKGREEMYFFSYMPRVEDQNGVSTRIALRSVFKNGKWSRKVELDEVEQKIISKRFHEEIISELESITKTKSKSEHEIYEQSENDYEHSGKRSNLVLVIDSTKYSAVKKVLSLREKSDSAATVLMNGKFDVPAVLKLEEICAKVKTDDFTMQSFTTTVEDLFYSHMASFTNYYMANPNSCLRGKLKLSMEEYMSAYAPKDRMKKHLEKNKRILKKAELENFSPKQISFLHALFDNIKLRVDNF
ncbi:hypothetical protein TH53_22850 [Pedobacter lusitanus]|uniref:Lipoprotein n=1 Tax=Pedobacter lusitanus TaxID=1503925 RepID=A0A0D0FRI2_9SPHI|nr:hypothetical protein [Pedobacter lusitanus]KIO75084.1 hypothetical protein TH53_22850 [Pedobacter lusitanus]